MNASFPSYQAFRSEFKTLHPGGSLNRMHSWTDPQVFATDVKRAMSAPSPLRGRGAYEDYANGQVRYGLTSRNGKAVTLGPPPAPRAMAPVHLGIRISGDLAKKKIEANLPKMEKAFRSKQAKGRAATVMTLYHLSKRDGGYYYFVLVTSDDANGGTAGQHGWEPTGNHETLVWAWASTSEQRRIGDLADTFALMP